MSIATMVGGRVKRIALVSVVLLLGGSSAAWAFGAGPSPDQGGPARAKPFEIARTYELTVHPDGPAEQQTSWTVGQVRFEAGCGVARHPEDPVAPVHLGGGGGVTNLGPDRVRVWSGEASFGWMGPGESTDMGPLGPGEVVNEDFPDGQGSVETVTVFDEGGISATGRGPGPSGSTKPPRQATARSPSR